MSYLARFLRQGVTTSRASLGWRTSMALQLPDMPCMQLEQRRPAPFQSKAGSVSVTYSFIDRRSKRASGWPRTFGEDGPAEHVLCAHAAICMLQFGLSC